VGNFQLGLSAYSTVAVHPNGHDLVVIAGGLGYVVRPDDHRLVETFGGGVMGVWPAPSLNLLVFDDSGIAFRALGVEGWWWKTRRISWDGFRGVEIAEKTIYGLGWNAVLNSWQPFKIEIATGAVGGGAYSEVGQQWLARAQESTVRSVSLRPLSRRIAEVVVGLFAIALGLFTVYLVADSARTGELTWAGVRENWGLAYAGLFVTAVVLVLGVRLVFPSLAPRRRLLTRSGIVAFVGLYLAMWMVMYVDTGVVPTFLAVGVGCGIGVIAIRKWFS
jgi:hypothetical protein